VRGSDVSLVVETTPTARCKTKKKTIAKNNKGTSSTSPLAGPKTRKKATIEAFTKAKEDIGMALASIKLPKDK